MRKWITTVKNSDGRQRQLETWNDTEEQVRQQFPSHEFVSTNKVLTEIPDCAFTDKLRTEGFNDAELERIYSALNGLCLNCDMDQPGDGGNRCWGCYESR